MHLSSQTQWWSYKNIHLLHECLQCLALGGFQLSQLLQIFLNFSGPDLGHSFGIGPGFVYNILT